MVFEIMMHVSDIAYPAHLNIFFKFVSIKCDVRSSSEIFLLVRELLIIFDDTNIKKRR